jgi:hypothetical protein
MDQIRAIGSNPELIAETVRLATAQSDQLVVRLQAEAKALRRELQGKRSSLKRLVVKNAGAGESQPIQERIEAIAARLTALPVEMVTAKRTTIRELDVRSALESFGPLWQTLRASERADVLGLLVEAVTYRDQTITLRFSQYFAK